jgi:hypothetical protein
MRGFLLGLLVAALAFGGYLFWKSSQGPGSESTASAGPDAGATKKKRKRRPRGARARTDAQGRPLVSGEPEPEPVKLSAADLRNVAQGDNLGKPEVMRLDMGNDSQLPELSQDDIDGRFRAREDAILDCIARARPDEEAYVPGVVSVRFRIQRQGSVKGVRVEAPAILHKGGLYNCVRTVVEGLRFPPSGSSQIVTYPFRLS